MNAAEYVSSLSSLQVLASVATLVRRHFPSASPDLSPWRKDPETLRWCEHESLDIAFHFPGWSPKVECRTMLFQLRLGKSNDYANSLYLLGVIISGMTYEGERWRMATVGDWHPTGRYLPQKVQIVELQTICRELFTLFAKNCS